MAIPRYRMAWGVNSFEDIRRFLHVERLEIASKLDGSIPPNDEEGVVAVNLGAGDVEPRWKRLSDLFKAKVLGVGQPTYSNTFGSFSRVVGQTEIPTWLDICSGTVVGGGGAVTIAAVIKTSAHSNGTAVRGHSVRLLVDGLAVGETLVVPSSDNAGGATNTTTIATANYMLPVGITHRYALQWRNDQRADSATALTLYSNGSSITVTAFGLKTLVRLAGKTLTGSGEDTIAHGQSSTPIIVSLIPRTAGTVYESNDPDATNLKLTGSTAMTVDIILSV